jgi:hypothetical protein
MTKPGSDALSLYNQYKSDLKPYLQQPWMSGISWWFGRRDAEIKELQVARAHVEKHKGNHEAIYKVGKAALGDPAAFRAWYKTVGDLKSHANIAAKGDHHAFPRGRNIRKDYSNPFYKEGGGFFGTTGFLSSFTEGDMDKVVSMDLTKSFTALPFPGESEDFEHIAYWFLKLRAAPEDWEVEKHELKRVTKLQNIGNQKLDELFDLVRKYLRNNDRNSLKKALALLPEFKNFHDKNEQQKNKIKIVYRGLADRYDPKDEEDIRYNSKTVIERESQQEFVATTLYKDTAERFVYSGGAHLIRKANSDNGWLITYEVDYDSVILDTTIFGGIFDEDEIVISPNKVNAYEIEYLYGDEYDEKRNSGREWDDD